MTLALASSAHGAKVKDTHFSHDRGFYTEPIAVEISSKTEAAAIYYTTDGSAPEPDNGSRYESPIEITRTTVLRAAAFKDGLEPTNVDTQTYVFAESVAAQTGNSFPQTWGEREGKPVVADYAMDPDITGSNVYRERLVPALTSLPVVSLALDPGDWLDPAQGIYTNTMESGVDWERSASAEMIFPVSDDEQEPLQKQKTTPEKNCQVDCGLRIQGGWNRRPEESPKHSLRLLFKKKYGAGKWKQPLFPASSQPPETDLQKRQKEIESFNTLILRGGNNNTWLHWSGEERKRGDYLRDQWMRDTFAAMGQVSARGRYVHLFINGLYWGLYNLAERPDAAFLASHFGKDPDDYDSRNGDKVISGDDVAWKELMEIVNDGITTDEAYAQVAERLDLANFADFILLNLYGANADYDHASNWYAGRRRKAGEKYRFYIWDGERTNESADNNTIDYDVDQSPPRIFQKLRSRPEFRLLLAERVRLHCSGNGALSPQASTNRFAFRAREIEQAIVAEAARWGDYRRDVDSYKTGPFELYTPDDFWQVEIERLKKDYFPIRTERLIDQLRAAGLDPDI
ncbi:MAG: CotH kinase family protein [Verrucomicrobiales bacterium]